MRASPLVLVLFALVVGDASASTVSVEQAPGGRSYVAYESHNALKSVLTVSGDQTRVVVTDTGDEPDPGAGCVAQSSATVVCEQPGLIRVDVDLGTNDDIMVAPPAGAASPAVRVTGGPGNDRLAPGNGRNVITGGSGIDELIGGAGNDRFVDGDTTGAQDADLIDGGEGTGDTVDYSARTDPVVFDGAVEGGQGEADENDTIRNVENALGGQVDDQLAGVGRLQGGHGDDVLRGPGVLRGGPGADELDAGGPGESPLASSLDGGGATDAFRCSPDREETIVNPKSSERLDEDCDTLRYGRSTFPVNPLSVHDGVATFRVQCRSGCDGTLRVFGQGKIIGTAPVASARVKVRLTKLGRRLAERGVQASASIRGKRVPRVGWSFVLAG